MGHLCVDWYFTLAILIAGAGLRIGAGHYADSYLDGVYRYVWVRNAAVILRKVVYHVLYWPLATIGFMVYLIACIIGALVDGAIIGSKVIRGKPVDRRWHY